MMFTPPEIDDIAQRVREWLVETDGELEDLDLARFSQSDLAPPGDDGTTAGPPVGMLQLVEVLTALRHELKLHTKSARQVQDSVGTSLDGLDRAIRKFDSVRPDEVRAAEEAARPLVDVLMDLDDAVGRAAAVFDACGARLARTPRDGFGSRLDAEFQRLPWWRRALARRWHERVCQVDAATRADDDRTLRSLLDGIRLLRARLDKRLSDSQIERVDCVGRLVDPKQMTVVDLVDDPNRAPETVAEEIRPGYLWRGRVVRCAEVRAVRKQTSLSDDLDDRA